MSKRIAFIIYSDPKIYPPTINAANILAERGWAVDIFGIKHETKEDIRISNSVKIYYFDKYRRGVEYRIQFVIFCIWVAMKSIFNRYSYVIAYDTMAVLPGKLSSFFGRSKWGYHNHDMWDLKSVKGWYKWLKRFELKLANTASFVSFPQEQRAEIFKKEADLKKDPIIVYNGPRLSWKKNIDIHPELERLRSECKHVVLYQGCLSKDFQLERLLAAIPLCQANIGICLVGKELEQGIKDRFLNEAERLGLKNKIIILPVLPYDRLPSVTRYCDIGIAKFSDQKSGSINDYLLVGASNKLSEYMAFGLPILAPDTPVNRKIIQENGHGFVCDISREKSIAQHLDLILQNRERYENIKNVNMSSFEKVYNYDVQFEKVAQLISNRG